ncbi:unnamed protein product [Brassica rapa subsp. narinosa]
MAPREGTARPKKLFPERVRLRREVRPEISGQLSGQVEGSVRLLVAEHEILLVGGLVADAFAELE